MSHTRRSLAVLLAAIAALTFSVTGTDAAIAKGKPANGTVGNADDKSPSGQSKDDKNAGYECDRNNGVGKGNPAHSGCEAEATTTTVPGEVTTTTTEAEATTTTTEPEPTTTTTTAPPPTTTTTVDDEF